MCDAECAVEQLERVMECFDLIHRLQLFLEQIKTYLFADWLDG